jgi:Na+-transporting NADH:ubiquinone oxidoreductase subunit F
MNGSLPFIPIVLIGVSLFITGLIILVDYFLGGSSEKIITLNERVKIPVTSEDTVLNLLSQNKIFVPSACGGKATCGYCKVTVTEGGGTVKPTEEPYLSKDEKARGVRLSCQVKVKENIKIEIPESMMSAKEYHTVVEEVRDLTYDTKMVRFKLINPPTMEFKPGQYAQLRVPGIEIIRAYSMSHNPKDTNHVEMIIRKVPNGKATTFVHEALEVGDKIVLTGPYGNFYLREQTNRDMICIAGGSGKAPIRSILHYLRDRGMPRNVKYFFGAKTTKDLYYTEEFMDLQKQFPKFQYLPALSEPKPEENWQGQIGLITQVVDRNIGDLSEVEAYLCGSPGMINACVEVLRKHNIKEENIFYDRFS